MKTTDYIIIGQGIAGSVLAFTFLQRNIDFVAIDCIEKNASKQVQDFKNKRHSFHCASMVSTGLINPVTGRRFVKSWKVDQLLPFAEKFYRKVEQQTNSEFLKEIKIWRFFQDIASENEWFSKKNDAQYERFKVEKPDFKELNDFSLGTNAIQFKMCFQLNSKLFLQKIEKLLISKNKLIIANLKYEEINFKEDFLEIPKLNLKARKIIFCEGYQAMNNPFFKEIPFTCQRGQLLNFKADLNFKNRAIKQKYMLSNHSTHFSIGTTWDWNEIETAPTQAALKELKAGIAAMTHKKFEIKEHLAGVRPTIKDRRPVIGVSKTQPKAFIFNGLGSKGSSIAPFFANEFLGFLMNKSELDKAVNVKRFF